MPNPPLIANLRSVELTLPNAVGALDFFTSIWGLSLAETDGPTHYLHGTGDDPYLISIREGAVAELNAVTLRAYSIDALSQIALQATRAGGQVLTSQHSVSDHGGGEAIVIRDPQGRNLRIVANDALKPIKSEDANRPIRLAHAVLNSADVSAVQPFYELVLGCVMSDRTGIMSFLRFPQPGLGDHHSIALADADNNCLNHIAFVMPTLEAVMRGGGRMRDAGYPIEWGPGRHGPGDNAFNYFIGPSGVPIEYTAEVEQVDCAYVARGPADWKWPGGRYDHWGISTPPSARLKEAQRKIAFAVTL